jgi:small subunit ribosomal protein S2
MVDTNSDPREVDYVIPANDDASKSIENILTHVTDAVIEGLSERKAEKDAKKADKEVAAAPKAAKETPAPKVAKETAAPKAEAAAPAVTEEAPAKEEEKK